jgi:hypothetical protein
MIDISFEINGRKINPNRIGDALERAALKSVKEQIVKKIGSIRDPKTGERPKIKIVGRNLDNLSFEVSGSQELVDLVKKKMG